MRYLTLGILAHVDAGKTTLSESILYNAGAIRSSGRVDHRDTFLDTHEIEKERGITVFSKQAVFDMPGTRVILVDTPGHSDFTSEAERTLAILDAAILVVSSSDMVTGHTRFLFERIKRYRIPVFVFFNKMDMDGSDKAKLLGDIRTKLDGIFADFTCSPDDTEFMEEIALTDEKLMESYLEGKLILDDKLLASCVSNGKVIPCYFGSALKNEGVRELMDGIARYIEEKDYPDERSMRVYKISTDEKNTRLTFAKITGGCYEVKDVITEYEEKIEQIRLYSGRTCENITKAEPGMLVAFTGISKSAVGDGIGAVGTKDGLFVTEPVLQYKVISKKNTDPAVLIPKLKKLEEEEPGLDVTWEEEKKEILIRLMGRIQLEVIQRLMMDRFDEPVEFDRGSIVYKETVSEKVEGMGHFEPLRHYAEVHLIIEPAEEGSGVVTDNICDGDLLAKNWQNLIMTHLTERKYKGKLTGSELTDVKITLASGKAHLKHTEGGDFRQAVYRAVRNGIMKAKGVLLEPWYSFVLEIPEYAVGRAMTELGTLGADFRLSENSTDQRCVINGVIPASEGINYIDEVRKYTKGEGRLELEFCGYKPCHNAEEVIALSGYDPERDVRNTGDSVFCEHGAGVIVPWYEAASRMHLPPVLSSKDEVPEEFTVRGGTSSGVLSIDEIDAIIERTYFANKKKGSSPIKKTGKMILDRTRKDEADVPKNPSSPRNDRYLSDKAPKKIKRAYTLVDGYNVIFSWEELAALARLNIDSARDHLLDIMCNYKGLIEDEIIVVFDAYRVKGHDTEYMDHNNIHVVFTKEAQTADSYIERFVHEHTTGFDITVVTSDSTEQVIVMGAGCRVCPSKQFRDIVTGKINEGTGEFTGREEACVNSLAGHIGEKIKEQIKD